MRNTSILFKAGTLIELSFATVIEGKEAQVFDNYFPQVMPILGELGGQPLGSFTVTASTSKLDSPKMGALFQWPNLKAFQQLHEDPRFLAIKGIRDDALAFFSNGHFFVVNEDTEVNFEEGQAYALQACWKGSNELAQQALVKLSPSGAAIEQAYQPESLFITRWDSTDDAEFIATYGKDANEEDIFKFVLNFPQ